MNHTARKGLNWRAIVTLTMAAIVFATLYAWVATIATATR